MIVNPGFGPITHLAAILWVCDAEFPTSVMTVRSAIVRQSISFSAVAAWAAFIVWSFLPCLPQSAIATERDAPPLYIVLEMDTSASMAVSDPQRLLPKAVELLLKLLPAQSRVQILGFDSHVRDQTELLHLDDEQRRKVANFAKEIVKHTNVGTDFLPPLEAALQTLTPQSGENYRPVVLLFSDGITNVGSNAENQGRQTQVLQQTAAQLQAAGIRVFTIAFSEHVDARFLREIAELTGGLAMIAAQPEQLSDLFTTLFEILEQPDMLPVDRVVHVDEHVSSLSLLLQNKPGTTGNVALVTPQGDLIDAASNQPDVRWTSGQGYQLVDMDHPQHGDWQIQQPAGEHAGKAYIMSDVSLRVEAPTLLDIGASPTPTLRAWLDRGNGEVLKAPALHIQAKISRLNDQRVPDVVIELADKDGDGRFEQTLPRLEPGAYLITVEAEAKNLRRIKKHGLTVAALPKAETPASPPSSGDDDSDAASLIALVWINLALLPIVAAAVYWHVNIRKRL
ncbi:MAG: VWA domain-containing protein [Methylococcaceae bacterium]|nr:MAG: VWA domain-containing protein [Methylococcaceae bacterium]